MALDAGKVVGTLELQDKWNTTLEQAAANTKTFETTVQTSMTRASAATGQLSTTTLSLESRYAVAQATVRVLDRNIGALTDEIVKSGAATAAQKSQLDTLTATLTRVQAAAAGFQRELATTGATASEAFGSVNRLLGVFGAGLSAAAVVQFTKGLIDSAGALVDLNAKTGVSIEQLQRWGFVGAQAGVTTEQFADAAFRLGVKLAGGSGSVHTAVEKLGLSYAELRKQSPEAQFNTIIAALEGMESPQERNRLAVELFGKSFAAIAPAVASGYTEIAKQATVSSDAQIKAIDRASDRWDAFYANQKTRLTAHLGDAVQKWEVFANLTSTQQAKLVAMAALGGTAFSAALDGYVKEAQRAAAALQEFVGPRQEQAAAATANYTIELVKAQVAVNHLTRDQIAQVEAGKALGKTSDEIINDMGITEGMLKVIIQRQEDRTKAETKAAEAAKKAAEIEAAAVLATTKLWDEYFTLRTEHGGTANQIAIAQIDKWAADLTAQMQKAGSDTKEFYDALAAVSKEKMGAVGVDWELWRTKSIPALREAEANARKTYSAMIVSGQFFREDLEKQRQKIEEARDAARGYGKDSVAAQEAARKATEKHTAALDAQKKAEEAAAQAAANRALGGSFDVTSQNFEQTITGLITTGGRNPTGTGSTLSLSRAYDLARQGYSLNEIVDILSRGGTGPVPPPRGPRIPGFSGGGYGDFGAGTLAMLHGPEAIVPLPAASGGSIARGGGSLAPTIIHIDARNSMFTDRRSLGELGRIVDAALVEHARNLGKNV